MFVEVGSMMIVTLLAWAGVPVPQVTVDSSRMSSMIMPECTVYDANSCLDSEVCEIFIADSGAESCALACDLRDAASCETDGECQLINGACDFPADEPAGC